jgi:hypothetical protein
VYGLLFQLTRLLELRFSKDEALDIFLCMILSGTVLHSLATEKKIFGIREPQSSIIMFDRICLTTYVPSPKPKNIYQCNGEVIPECRSCVKKFTSLISTSAKRKSLQIITAQ